MGVITIVDRIAKWADDEYSDSKSGNVVTGARVALDAAIPGVIDVVN